MVKQHTKDELWKLFDRLPEELKEAVFSQETADHIFSICERYDVDNVSEVARHVGLVLMGVLMPNELMVALTKEVGLKKPVAEKVAQEINRFIFYPVQSALKQLHRVEVGEVEKGHSAEVKTIAQSVKQGTPKEKVMSQEKPLQKKQKSGKADPYRESIE